MRKAVTIGHSAFRAGIHMLTLHQDENEFCFIYF